MDAFRLGNHSSIYRAYRVNPGDRISSVPIVLNVETDDEAIAERVARTNWPERRVRAVGATHDPHQLIVVVIGSVHAGPYDSGVRWPVTPDHPAGAEQAGQSSPVTPALPFADYDHGIRCTRKAAGCPDRVTIRDATPSTAVASTVARGSWDPALKREMPSTIAVQRSATVRAEALRSNARSVEMAYSIGS